MHPDIPSSPAAAERGDSRYWEGQVRRLLALRDPGGRPLLAICCFDNRGVGHSSIPQVRGRGGERGCVG